MGGIFGTQSVCGPLKGLAESVLCSHQSDAPTIFDITRLLLSLSLRVKL
jgi:hypothetical protein